MKKLLLTLIVLSSFYQVQASHILGGELYYEQDAVNPNKYKITLILYGESSGISIGSSQQIATNVPGSSAITVSLTAMSGRIVKYGCQNTAKLYKYRGYITINTLPVGGATFNWISCCRSVGVDNLTTPQNYGFSVSARMFSKNGSSPRFSFPNIYGGIAMQSQNFNFSAYDPDQGDSVYILLVNPKQMQNNGSIGNIPFASGYTKKKPFGVNAITQIDSLSGLMSVANVPIGNYVASFLIRSYTKGVVTSVSSKDILFSFNAAGKSPEIELIINYSTGLYKKYGNSYYFEMVEGDLLDFTIKGKAKSISQNVDILGYGDLLTNNSGGANCSGANCASFVATNGSFSNKGVTYTNYSFKPDTNFVDSSNTIAFKNFSFTVKVKDTCGVYRTKTLTVNISVKKAQSMYSVSSYSYCKGAAGVKAQIKGDTSSVLWYPSYGVSDTLLASPLLNPDSNMVYTVSNSNSGVNFKVHVFIDSLLVNSFKLTNTGTELIVPTIDSMQTHSWFYNGVLLPVDSDTLPILLTGFYWATLQKGACLIYSDTIKAAVLNKLSNSNAQGNGIKTGATKSSFEFSLNHYSNTLTDLQILLPNVGHNKSAILIGIEIRKQGVVLYQNLAVRETQNIWKVENINKLLQAGQTYTLEMLTKDVSNLILFKPQTLPFTEDNGIVNIISGQYTENGNVIQGAYPYVNFVFSSPIGIKENNLVANIYPNPAANLLFIEMQGAGSFKVLDIQGRIVLNAEVDGDVKLDISELTSGIYIYTLENELGVKMGKLVVE